MPKIIYTAYNPACNIMIARCNQYLISKPAKLCWKWLGIRSQLIYAAFAYTIPQCTR